VALPAAIARRQRGPDFSHQEDDVGGQLRHRVVVPEKGAAVRLEGAYQDAQADRGDRFGEHIARVVGAQDNARTTLLSLAR